MTKQTRIILYLTAGFVIGVTIDLSGIISEALIRHDDIVQVFSTADQAEFLSSLITGCLAALGGVLFALKDDALMALLAKIRQQNTDLNTVLANSPLAKIVVSPELMVLYHNEPAVSFQPLGIAVGVPFPALQEWRQHQEFSVQNQGRVAWYRLYESPIQWQGTGATLASLLDITADKEAERLRVDVERIIHHDIRSPLSGIIGIANLMLDRGSEWEGTEECLQEIKASAEKVYNLVDQVALIYKLEGGQWECPLQPVNLFEITESAVRRMKVHADSSKVVISVLLQQGTDQQTCTCQGNPILLDMLVENLLKNAVEASGPGDRVTVAMSAEDGRLCLKVTNPGSIPTEIRDRFFEKYVTHGKRNGTGLGTYLCKLITNTLNGSISVLQNDVSPTVSITVCIPQIKG